MKPLLDIVRETSYGVHIEVRMSLEHCQLTGNLHELVQVVE